MNHPSSVWVYYPRSHHEADQPGSSQQAKQINGAGLFFLRVGTYHKLHGWYALKWDKLSLIQG